MISKETQYFWFNLSTGVSWQFNFWLENKNYDMTTFTLEKTREYILNGLK